MHLTAREAQIVDAILTAASNKVIADRLGLTEQSVKNRLTGVYRKLGIGSRLELVLLFARKRSAIEDSLDAGVGERELATIISE